MHGDLDTAPALAPGSTRHPHRVGGLEIISEADDNYIVYQPERGRAHFLNGTAILVLELCTGRNTAADIADLVRKAYRLPAAPTAEIGALLTQFEDEGLTVPA